MHVASDAFVVAIYRMHVVDCIGKLTVQRFPNATDETRRVAVVEKLKAALAELDAATAEGVRP